MNALRDSEMAYMALGESEGYILPREAQMLRRSLSCMLAGCLLIFPAELYAFADPEWHGTGGIIAATMLVFCSVVGLMWLTDEIGGV